MIQKLSYLEKNWVEKTSNLKTERSKWSSIAQKARVSFVAYLHVWAAFVTKQKSLGWSKTSKRKWKFEFVESIALAERTN